MSAMECSHPPRFFIKGGREYRETCARPSRHWTVEKRGFCDEQHLCDHHAEVLRKQGFNVRIKVGNDATRSA